MELEVLIIFNGFYKSGVQEYGRMGPTVILKKHKYIDVPFFLFKTFFF